MTTITPFAPGSYTVNRNTTQLLALKDQLGTLSTQLSTGRTAETYAGLGSARTTALAAQSTISALAGYSAGIAAAQTRTTLAVTSLTQVATLATGARSTLNKGLQSATLDTNTGRALAQANLETALDTLNQSAAGNYLFGGRNTSTQPVLDADTILNGTTNAAGQPLAGLKTLVSEQVTADLGAFKNGRTTVSLTTTPTASVTLSDDTLSGAAAKFGFSVASAPIVTGTAISASYTPATATTPGSVSLDLGPPPGRQPAVGDTVTFSLNLPDGTTTTLSLVATAPGNATTSTTFALGAGADAATTASNLSTSLDAALRAAAGSTLTVNATARAVTDFFGASAGAGTTPHRITTDAVTGKPSGYATGAASNTVVWYQGEDGGTDPRTTQTVQVGANSTIGTGARANEPAIRNVLSGLAIVALGVPNATSAYVNATYSAIVDRAGALLNSADTSPSVQDRVSDLGLASARLSNAAATNKATQNTLQDTLDGIEQAPTQEVAAKLLDVQNRLQASYQVTASIAKLSLVNYLN